VSVTSLAATDMYLVCESKVRCYNIPYSVPNACIVWISLKMPVLASFADAKLLDFSPKDTQLNVPFIRSHAMLYTAHALGMAAVLCSVSVHDVSVTTLAANTWFIR
jgi:hypothetical protein